MDKVIEITDVKTDNILSSTLFSEFEKFCKRNHYFKQAKQFTKIKFFSKFDQLVENMNNNTKKVKHRDGYYYTGMKYKK